MPLSPVGNRSHATIGFAASYRRIIAMTEEGLRPTSSKSYHCTGVGCNTRPEIRLDKSQKNERQEEEHDIRILLRQDQ